MAGPLARLAAALGLLMMIPIGYQVVTGGLEIGDAALRAAVTLVAVLAVQRIANTGVRAIANSMDRIASSTTPSRRATDH